MSGSTSMRRLTCDSPTRYPVWSKDGRHIAYQLSREGDGGIYSIRADGTAVPERLTKAEPGTSHIPESWSPEGRTLLYSVVAGEKVTLWTLQPGGETSPLAGIESAGLLGAEFSPNGRWIAYGYRPGATNTTVFVQPFPPTGAKIQISKDDDGHHPVWARDGRKLYYIPAPGSLLSVDVTTTPTFTFGIPVAVPRVFSIGNSPLEVRGHDLAPDGKEFIGVTLAQAARDGSNQVQAVVAPEIHVVLNWFEELKQRAPRTTARQP